MMWRRIQNWFSESPRTRAKRESLAHAVDLTLTEHEKACKAARDLITTLHSLLTAQGGYEYHGPERRHRQVPVRVNRRVNGGSSGGQGFAQ